MKAFQLRSYDGPSGLELNDISAPRPSENELLVAVEAIGINFPDLLMVQGKYQLKPELPFVPGCEIAGTVLSAPPGSGWQVGERACAFVWSGGFAEQALVPVATACRVPPDVSSIMAAGITVNYQTALFALQRRGAVDHGESVFVLGAAGGIGTAAVQLAKAMGAHVLAGVATAEQIPTATEAGADEVFVLEQGFASKVRLGAGVDVVVDPLGDWIFSEAIRCLNPGGRLLVLGFAAGQVPEVAVNRLLLRNISVVGVAFGAFLDLEPELSGNQADRIFQYVREGLVRPQVSVVSPFADLPMLLTSLSSGSILGKAVVSGFQA